MRFSIIFFQNLNGVPSFAAKNPLKDLTPESLKVHPGQLACVLAEPALTDTFDYRVNSDGTWRGPLTAGKDSGVGWCIGEFNQAGDFVPNIEIMRRLEIKLPSK